MALSSKAGKTKKSSKELWAQKTKLWSQSPAEWKRFLEILGAERVSLAGTQIKFCCPYHDDHNPSAYIHTTKGFFKCFSESCSKGVRDPILLVQQLLGGSYTDAFTAFRRHFKLSRAIRNEDVKQFDEDATQRRRMSLASDVMHDYLCNVWQATPLPASAKLSRDWLRDTRGLSDIIAHNALGMLPRKPDFERLCGEKHASGEDTQWILKLFGEYLGTGYTDCIVYTYALAPDHITAFKLRKPGPSKDSVRVVKLQDDEEMGAFGLTHAAYVPLIWGDKLDNVILVEGEHDELTAYNQQCALAVHDEIFLALGGGGHQGVDFLSALGITKASIVGDHDDAGEEYPINLLKKTKNVSFKIFEWPLALQNVASGPTDPDESIRFHGFPTFSAEVTKDSNYTFASRWCKNKAVAEMSGVAPDDVVQQETIVAEVASLLRNDAELRSFAAMIAEDYPLLTPARIRLAAAKFDDTPLGFVHSIEDWITQQFHVISMDNVNNTLRLWHKEKRILVDIALGLHKGITTFKSYTPTGVLYEWVRDEIGLPSYLPDPEAVDAVHASLSKCEKDISESVDIALSALGSSAVQSAWLLKGQGIHLSNILDREEKGYVVNGNRVYKLEWNEFGDKLKTVSELPGPSDGNTVFDLHENKLICEEMSTGWLPSMESPADFTVRPKFTLQECYQHVFDIFNMSCEFAHQKVDSTYSALLVFYSYVADAMQKRVMTHVLGEHEAGKSSYLSLAANHAQMRECALTYHAATLDDCTAPAVFQAFGGSRVLMGLDEVNDPDDGTYDSTKVKMLYRRLRGLATKGMADYSVGTADGEGRSYFLHNPVITASATVIVHRMDRSRFNTIHLRKNPQKPNTRMLLREKYGIEFFEDLRHSILLGMLGIAPKVAQAYQNIYTSTAKSQNVNINRFRENLLPLVAVAKAMDVGGDAFLTAYAKSREDTVVEDAAESPGNELLDFVINSPYMQVGSDEVPMKKSLRSVLQRYDWRENINGSDTGIYYDEKTGYIGVVWPQVRQTLLVGTLSKYGRMSLTSLRSKSAESANYVRIEDAEAKGVIARLRAEGMAGSSAYSIFDVSFIAQDAANARKEVDMQESKE